MLRCAGGTAALDSTGSSTRKTFPDERLLGQQALLRPAAACRRRRIPREPREGAAALSAEAGSAARRGDRRRRRPGELGESVSPALLLRCARKARGLVP